MIDMYNADVTIHMLRGTQEHAIDDEFIEEWAYVQIFLSHMFEEVEEVTGTMLWGEVVGEDYVSATDLDLGQAHGFLARHISHFQAEYERVQRKHAVDLTSDEE
jgi:hypothetical protein